MAADEVAHEDPLRVSRTVARELQADGARAVVLTGSHARGVASRHSDIDLVAIYARPRGDRWRAGWSLMNRGGHLVSVAPRTSAGVRAAFRDPRQIPTSVPGWRDARVLHDPEGIAKQLKAEARRFRWAAVAEASDAWVAEATTGWSEEVHKLVAMLEQGETLGAGVQRSVLAIHLAPIMALHRRILYGSENRLWDIVADAMGEPWASTQRAALGAGGEPFDESCRAALRLFTLAADAVMPLLNDHQRAVVAHATALAQRAIR